MAKEKRVEPAHFRRIKKLFGFTRCNERRARVAAQWLRVENPKMLRDEAPTAASKNALDTLLLAANDAWIAKLKRDLTAAEAMREENATAAYNSAREITAAVTVRWTAEDGRLVTYHVQPYEIILADLLVDKVHG